MILAALLAAATAGGVLQVEVTNVRNAAGRVHVDLCDERTFLEDGCPYAGDAPARMGTTTVTVRGVPPGRYAVQAYHDENANGRVDRAIFGIPKEGIGFSRDARIRFGPPKWADAVFVFNGGAERTALRLRYFLGAGGPPASR